MLEEVRGAIGLIRFGSRTGIDPHANGRRLRIRRVLGSDLSKSRVSNMAIGGTMNANWVGSGNGELTVSPFLRVVLCVLTGPVTLGVAKLLVNGGRERPVRARRPLVRFRASLRDAIGTVWLGGEGFEWFVFAVRQSRLRQEAPKSWSFPQQIRA